MSRSGPTCKESGGDCRQFENGKTCDQPLNTATCPAGQLCCGKKTSRNAAIYGKSKTKNRRRDKQQNDKLGDTKVRKHRPRRKSVGDKREKKEQQNNSLNKQKRRRKVDRKNRT